jgi:hypothetical protein
MELSNVGLKFHTGWVYCLLSVTSMSQDAVVVSIMWLWVVMSESHKGRVCPNVLWGATFSEMLGIHLPTHCLKMLIFLGGWYFLKEPVVTGFYLWGGRFFRNAVTRLWNYTALRRTLCTCQTTRRLENLVLSYRSKVRKFLGNPLTGNVPRFSTNIHGVFWRLYYR